MEDKRIKIKIDKTNKLLVCMVLLAIISISVVLGCLIGYLLELSEFITEIIILVVLVIISLLAIKLFSRLFREQELEAEFKVDYVVLKKKMSKRVIYYKDITEVQKIMVIDRLYDEKGYYRVRIKNKDRTFVMYSTDEEYQKHLDFEQVELSMIYYEFKRRGIKCC